MTDNIIQLQFIKNEIQALQQYKARLSAKPKKSVQELNMIGKVKNDIDLLLSKHTELSDEVFHELESTLPADKHFKLLPSKRKPQSKLIVSE